jgi:dTDP-glucose 4,6-dehydratase
MRVLITGGTGFVGRHLLDVIASDSTFLTLDDVIVASRSPQETRYDVETVTWDVTSASVPNLHVDAVIHAATPASAELNLRSPRLMFDQIVEGARHVIEFCATQPDPPRVVFTSSGAVYGEMPRGVTAWAENSRLAADPLEARNAYASGKRAAEAMFALAEHEGVCRPTMARLFAFSGRHLPLERHFALGNFVRDALYRGIIRVRGDGLTVRSYLDGDDMARWILAALANGQDTKVVHVGSEFPISIRDLAELVQNIARTLLHMDVELQIDRSFSELDGRRRYVPSTKITRSILNVRESVTLSESIAEMFNFNMLDDLDAASPAKRHRDAIL